MLHTLTCCACTLVACSMGLQGRPTRPTTGCPAALWPTGLGSRGGRSAGSGANMMGYALPPCVMVNLTGGVDRYAPLWLTPSAHSVTSLGPPPPNS